MIATQTSGLGSAVLGRDAGDPRAVPDATYWEGVARSRWGRYITAIEQEEKRMFLLERRRAPRSTFER